MALDITMIQQDVSSLKDRKQSDAFRLNRLLNKEQVKTNTEIRFFLL